jgi:hypothetical protein
MPEAVGLFPQRMEQVMKGGKGGQGRKRSSQRVSEKAVPRSTVKKGAAKKDWGAIPKDEHDPAPARQPTKERP